MHCSDSVSYTHFQPASFWHWNVRYSRPYHYSNSNWFSPTDTAYYNRVLQNYGRANLLCQVHCDIKVVKYGCNLNGMNWWTWAQLGFTRLGYICIVSNRHYLFLPNSILCVLIIPWGGYLYVLGYWVTIHLPTSLMLALWSACLYNVVYLDPVCVACDG